MKRTMALAPAAPVLYSIVTAARQMSARILGVLFGWDAHSTGARVAMNCKASFHRRRFSCDLSLFFHRIRHGSIQLILVV